MAESIADRDTRGYIHLDDALQAYVYKPPDWYRPTDAVDVLSSVFVGLGGLTGVERPQFDESWAAVERLENGTLQPYEQPLTRQDDW